MHKGMKKALYTASRTTQARNGMEYTLGSKGSVRGVEPIQESQYDSYCQQTNDDSPLSHVFVKQLLFNHHRCPSVLVLNLAVLDTTQSVIELLGDRTGLVAKRVALASVEVVYIRNR